MLRTDKKNEKSLAVSVVSNQRCAVPHTTQKPIGISIQNHGISFIIILL